MLGPSGGADLLTLGSSLDRQTEPVSLYLAAWSSMPLTGEWVAWLGWQPIRGARVEGLEPTQSGCLPLQPSGLRPSGRG